MSGKEKKQGQGTGFSPPAPDDPRVKQSGGSVGRRSKFTLQEIRELDGNFGRFYNDIIKSAVWAKLPSVAKVLYPVLLWRADNETGEVRYKDYAQLAEESGLKLSGIGRAVKALREAKLIRTEEDKTPRGEKGKRHISTHIKIWLGHLEFLNLELPPTHKKIVPGEAEIEKPLRTKKLGVTTHKKIVPTTHKKIVPKSKLQSKLSKSKRSSSPKGDDDRKSSSVSSPSGSRDLKQPKRSLERQKQIEAIEIIKGKLWELYNNENERHWLEKKKNHIEFSKKISPPAVEQKVIAATARKLWRCFDKNRTALSRANPDYEKVCAPAQLGHSYFNFICNRFRGADVPPHAGNFNLPHYVEDFITGDLRGRISSRSTYFLRGQGPLIQRVED